jgi:hypothetical protein
MCAITRKQQRRERQQESAFCLKSNLLAAAMFTAGILLLSLLTAAPIDPAIAALPLMVDIGAEGLVLFALLNAVLGLLGHASLSVGWSLEELWHLLLIQLFSATRVPPTHVKQPTTALISLLLAVRAAASHLTLCLVHKQACSLPPSKAPFRLFGRAPLLVSP